MKMDTSKRSASPNATKLKRKRKSKTKFTTSEQKNIKLDTTETIATINPLKPSKTGPKPKPVEETNDNDNEKYPILNNKELIDRFLKVQMTNNQKGRIRQAIRESLQGTSNVVVPEIIHNKIQSILKGSPNLTDSELRRIRILYNLLKTALKEKSLAAPKAKPEKVKKSVEEDTKPKKIEDKEKDSVKKEKTEKREQLVKKTKGPKRYVVFLGNLPLDVDKEKIINHFSEMNEHIIDIRIPKALEGKKNAIAYLELSNEPSYEFALSKHHSMLGNKRINVLYTAPKKGKVTKAGAKSKSAKLIALQKKGKLVGSIPLAKKRSQRRLKMKQAQAKLAAENA
ncbi:hypothetical protein B5X24_HaOG214543 [Helicoverpa armigera]|nr:uncharacterized protein LOC110373794 isoform X2 [Helicoverpa armigera]PZC80502.1 hypothetical protein B5X24_HaOG214543 [Helicoverpa armigera]